MANITSVQDIWDDMGIGEQESVFMHEEDLKFLTETTKLFSIKFINDILVRQLFCESFDNIVYVASTYDVSDNIKVFGLEMYTSYLRGFRTLQILRIINEKLDQESKISISNYTT